MNISSAYSRLRWFACVGGAFSVLAACAPGMSSGIETPEKPEVQAMLREADALRARGLKTEATSRYREAMEASQSGVRAHVELAAILAEEGRYAEASKILDRAIARQPKSLAVLHQQGRLALMQGQSETALAAAEKGLKLSASDTRLLNVKGVALDQSGKHSDAQPHYRQVMKEAAVEDERLAATNNLALSLVAGGEPEEAIQLLEPMVKNAKDPRALRQTLGLAYGIAGQDDKAYELGLLDMDLASVTANLLLYKRLREGELPMTLLFRPAEGTKP